MQRRTYLPPSFFLQPAPQVAQQLIGTLLVRDDGRAGRIVETEAYQQDDEASHTYRGKTERNRAMFEQGGVLYVYFTYGCHFCANVVTGPKGDGSAVLLRAVEPLEGIELMEQARGTTNLRQLCSGPGKLAQAFGITKELYGIDLRHPHSTLRVMSDGFVGKIAADRRIGISKAQDKRWRFVLKDSPFVSRPMAQPDQRSRTNKAL